MAKGKELFMPFNEFYTHACQDAPLAVTGRRPVLRDRQGGRAGKETQEDKMTERSRISRTLLRRIFVRFLLLQELESINFTEATEKGEVSWVLFLHFVQSGEGSIAAYEEKIKRHSKF